MVQEQTARDAFIIEKSRDKGFTPYEVQLLLEKNGFRKISRARIYQILESIGIKPKSETRARKK